MENIDVDVELLISLVEERSVLWDRSCDAYKSKAETTAAWRQICTHMNPSFESLSGDEKNKYGRVLISKWTNIRDRYMKYVKKIEEVKTTAGSQGKSMRKYIYSDNLSFLQKNMRRNDTVSCSLEELEDLGEYDETSNETRKKRSFPTLRRLSLNHDTPSGCLPSTSIQRAIIKRQKTTGTDREESIMNKLLEPEDRHISFFKGILPSLQKFDDSETLEFQGEVIRIIQSINRSRQTLLAGDHCVQPSPHMYPYPENVIIKDENV